MDNKHFVTCRKVDLIHVGSLLTLVHWRNICLNITQCFVSCYVRVSLFHALKSMKRIEFFVVGHQNETELPGMVKGLKREQSARDCFTTDQEDQPTARTFLTME